MTRTFTFKSVLAALFLTCCAHIAFAQTFWTETFSDQTTATTNWVHGGTNTGTQTWKWSNVPNAGAWMPAAFNAPTASTGYMWFDSDANGENFPHDVTLTGVGVPANCTGKSNVRLKFNTYYRSFSGTEVCRLGVSTDGTNFTYHNIPEIDALVQEGAGTSIYHGVIQIALPEAANQPQVWLQFRYQGEYEYYWKIDDLELIEETGPVPCDQNPKAIICDNFDSYSTAIRLGPQATHWTTWSGTEGGTEDGIVSTEQAFSTPNSLKIQGGGPQDVVLNLSNKTTGNYSVKWKLYFATGRLGYYNIQNVVPIGAGSWNMEVFFNANGAGDIQISSASVGTFTYPYNTWFDVEHRVDLDNNLISVYINGNFVRKVGYPNNLGGINFYGINAQHVYYVDNLEYVELDPVVFNVDECAGAVDLSLFFGQAPTVPQTTGIFDNTNATVSPTDPAAPSCWSDFVTGTGPVVPKLDGSMWFTFTGDGNKYHIETVPCTTGSNYIDDGDTQMAIYTGQCGSLTQILCNEDIYGNGEPDYRAGLDIETVNGTDYRMLIDGWSVGNLVATGQFCIEITRLPTITCAQGQVGTYTVSNNGIVCDATSTNTVLTLGSGYVIPTIGPVFGMSWAISQQPIPAGTWPPLATGYWGSFAVNQNPYIPNLTNSGTPLAQNQIWFFTPIVVASAIDNSPADPAFLHQLNVDNACFFVGQSTPLTLLGPLDPLGATTTVTPASPGSNNGAINLTITGGSGLFAVEWTGPGGFTSSDEDISGLATGTYTAIITDLTGCADEIDVTVSVTTSVKDPASVKSLTVNPNPTASTTLLNLVLETASDVRVEVVNTLGQTLQTIDAGKVNNYAQQIDLSRFNDGTYFLRVIVNGETAIRRVVLNR
ncbi:MAG: T9SS type A sorting domain-containing protein [Saprospiraceae bacterium]|nr:T9SS type A sorting domain-containing protein [Saprospiraceae bacterium]